MHKLALLLVVATQQTITRNNNHMQPLQKAKHLQTHESVHGTRGEGGGRGDYIGYGELFKSATHF